MKLIPIDPASSWILQQAVVAMASNGSRQISVWEHEGYSIMQSLDPSGDFGLNEWHVSVSKGSESVSWNIAEVYAKWLLPHVAAWERHKCGGRATHLFEIRA